MASGAVSTSSGGRIGRREESHHENVGFCRCIWLTGEDISQSFASEGNSEDEHFIDDEPVPRHNTSLDFVCNRYHGEPIPPLEGRSTTGVSEDQKDDEAALMSNEARKSADVWLRSAQAKSAKDLV
ncbi:hypothetical protein IMSHALPRED_006865 [Imshaugia aleurites]|uniref:Uncharacterized protein n=1 Tax=Imshaugia aleurites TaxID=172621 RepID=A0A8H3ISQ4_9LECA|nr:hypothetical protein IMSHALPRED_006865 [Imshaugia aleurites]